jgi:hypothetical protein
MEVDMPTLEEIRKILDNNAISSKVLPPNPQLDWILICEKFNGSKLGVGIAHLKGTDTTELFLHMTLGEDVKQAFMENNFHNNFMNEFDIITKALPHVSVMISPNLKSMKSVSIIRKLYGDITAQQLLESANKILETVGLVLALIRKHGKLSSNDVVQQESSFYA